MKKRGTLISSEMIPWLIVIALAIVVIVGYLAIRQSGEGLIDSLRQWLRFRG
jgi:disulfide bond formation protein DsbB